MIRAVIDLTMEETILALFEQNPDVAFSAKEVGRRVDRELFREDPNWAKPYLENLVRQRLLVTDAYGYWFKAREEDSPTKYHQCIHESAKTRIYG